MRLLALAIVVLVFYGVGWIVGARYVVYAAPPAALSHFTCYAVEGREQGQTIVGLRDQFRPFRTAVGPPRLLCAPTNKTILRGKPHVPHGPLDRLVCYPIAAPLVNRNRLIDNQLSRKVLRVGPARYTCIPTFKSGR